MQKYYKNQPKFNSVYLRKNLPQIKDGAYVVNLNDLESIRTHWIALCMNANNVTYFNSFRVKNILKEIKKLIGNRDIITNIYRMQA